MKPFYLAQTVYSLAIWLVILSLSMVSAYGGQASLTWDANTEANLGGYRLYYGQISRSYTANVDIGNKTSYTVTNLSDGATYYFGVTAYDTTKTLESATSNEVTTTLPIAVPVASFSATPTAGAAPLAVTFNDTSTGTVTGRSWAFGDGTTSTAQNPTKTYTAAGIYTVQLTVTGSGGSNSMTKTGYITVTAAAPAPVSSFSATPTTGNAPLAVTFTDSSTGTVTSRSWNFGDGTSSTAQNPTKTYTAAGTYTVQLTVTGSGGSNSVTKTGYITVTAPAPVSSFSATPTTGNAPLAVTFTDSSTGTVTSRSWNFGDGTSSTAQNPTKTYTAAGTYTVQLTVTGSGGSNSVTKTGYITVTAPAPVSSFSATPTTGNAPLAVAFTDSSTGSVTSRSWNFGDGTISTAQNPTKTYTAAGTYTVQLTVTGSGGSNSMTKTGYITVTAAAPAPVSSFSATPTTGNAPLAVTFTDSSTGTVTSRSWNFGDGTSSTAQNPTKTYTAAGTYTVQLTVTGSGGSNSVTKTGYITVTAPAAPVSSFSATPTTGPAPLAVTFANSSTGTGPLTYVWTFGDGGTSTAQNPAHTYATLGTYAVSLTVTDSNSTKNTKTLTGYITVSAASAGSGLVAAYNFEEASGTTVVDASGKGNHGIISGATRTTSGKFGNDLSLNGTSNWVTVNDSATLDLTTGMTLEAWVYPTTNTGNRSVLIKENAPGNSVYYLYANTSDDSNNTPLGGGVYGGQYQFVHGVSRLASSAWSHVTVTYDGVTERLYVNGQQVGTKAQAGSMGVSGAPLRIGGNSIWGEYFKGRIDEVRIYNRALSATEIQTDINTAVETSSPPKLLLGNQTLDVAVADSLPQGKAAAFQTSASVTGQVTSLRVYVDTGSGSTKLVAGIYRDSNGHPGALVAKGTLSSPVAGSWNKVRMPATAVTAGTRYWIAILSPNGSLKFRGKMGSTAGLGEMSASTTLTTLPSSWTTGTSSSGGPLSGYAAGY
ncbi:MAG: PKD domain-containing protein [Propionivibrio sp.]